MAAPPTTALEEDPNWAVDRATALPEVWPLVAEHGGLVAAWRMMRVCRAARVGAKEWLRRLPGFVVCGGFTSDGSRVSDVWRLDLATLRWEPLPVLLTGRAVHACCAVRGTVVVLGGGTSVGSRLHASVEVFSGEQGAFVHLPSLSRGRIRLASAIAGDESDSAAGQVLLLGGTGQAIASEVHLVDLATGTCTRQPEMLHSRYTFAAARLQDGRVVCAGGGHHPISAEVYGPRVQGSPDAPWTWTELPHVPQPRKTKCSVRVLFDGGVHTQTIAARSNDVTEQKLLAHRAVELCACMHARHLYINIGQSTLHRVPTTARRPPSFSAHQWNRNSTTWRGGISSTPRKTSSFESFHRKRKKHLQLTSPGDYLPHKERHTHHGRPPRHARGSPQLGRRPRHLPPRGMGPRRRARRPRRGVAADAGLQGGARVAEQTAGARCVRRCYWGCGESERRVEAGPGDAAVGAHACSRNRSLPPRVLRGEGHHRRPRWSNAVICQCQWHLEC
jgi:hypothetical protein